MAERSYLIVTTSPATSEQVFDLLADAPRWHAWAGSSIRESTWVNGTTGEVGAVRRLGRTPLYAVETITEFQRPHPDELHRHRPTGPRLPLHYRAHTDRRCGGRATPRSAHQSADDALLAITTKLDQFRGESRFTTWAYRFVIL